MRSKIVLNSGKSAEVRGVLGTSFGYHAGKNRVGVAEKVAWGVILGDLALVHDENSTKGFKKRTSVFESEMPVSRVVL